MKYSLLTYKYFIDVVETQGFTPAAKRNFVSQTAISNAIKNLEKDLGVQLIDRSTSHFKVTLAGINQYNCAVPVLKNYYEFSEKISQLNNSFKNLMIHYLSEEAQGIRNVGFTERDMRNYLRSKWAKTFEKRDAQRLLDYLNKKKIETSHFFQAIQFDVEAQMTNFYWD